MDTFMEQKYKDVLFDDKMIDLVSETIKKDEDMIKVLQLLLNNEIRKIKKMNYEGVTKKQLMELKVVSRKLDKKSNTFQVATIHITKPKANNIISFLDGATLIYFENDDRSREKPYFLTKRGVQICTRLMNEGILQKPKI